MITSLLDNDHYAFTMSNAIHAAGDDMLPVRYQFRNRTFSVPLASRLSIQQLQGVLNDIRTLRFQPTEIEWLRSQGTFSDDWLAGLPSYELPAVEVGQDAGHLTIRYEGMWSQAIFWESIILAVINEMYFSQFGTYLSEGTQRLAEKIGYLKERKSLRFAEFGTRRRYSRSWQQHVVHELMTEVPDLMVGTSNAKLAMDFGLRPIGTMAHQLFMVYTALLLDCEKWWSDEQRRLYGDAIGQGIHRVLSDWTNAYANHPELMTVLPDTYGTDAFIERAHPADLAPYNAFRQDSGDPIYRSRQLSYWAFHDLNISRPLIVPSDSLDVRKMSMIEDNLSGERQIGLEPNLVYGWGTNLTNDLGYEPLAIVIKPSHVWNGKEWLPCCKFSDDRQKITGTDEAALPYARLLGSWSGN